jgi:hypothetical protein
MAAGAGLVATGIVSAPVVALAGLAYTAYEVANASPELADWAGNTWNKFSYGEQADTGAAGVTRDSNEKELAGYASTLGATDVGSLQRAFNVIRTDMIGGSDGVGVPAALTKELKGMSPTDPRRKETIRTLSRMGAFGNQLTEKDITNIDNGLRSKNPATMKFLMKAAGSEKAFGNMRDLAKGKMAKYIPAQDIHNIRQVGVVTSALASKAKSREVTQEWAASQAINVGKKMQEIEVSSIFDDLGDAMNRGASSSEVSALSARAFGTAVDEFGRYVKGLPGNSLTAGNDNMLKLAAP